MKRFCFLLIFSLSLSAATARAAGFEKPIFGKTLGKAYPHILKSDEFSLNTRNIKVLTGQGKFLWMGTSNGVIRYDTTTANDYEVFDNQNVLLSNGIFAIVMDPLNRPWIGTYGGGLSHFNGTGWVNYNTPQGLCDAFVYDIEFTQDTMWVATWSGVNRVRGDLSRRDSWEQFTVKNTHGGLVDDWVYAIETGPDGRLWFGTESGLSMFDGAAWHSFDHADGLGAPYEAVKRENSSVMASFQGLHHASHIPDLPNVQSPDYRPNYIVSMLMDPKGRLWIGTWGGGLSMLDTRKMEFRNFTTVDGLPGNFILALEEGPDGQLWIGSNGGLSRFNGRSFTNFSEHNGLIGSFIFSIEFSDHALWVGSHHGMNRLQLDPLSGDLLKIQ